MTEPRTIRSLGVAAPGEAAFFTYEEAPPRAGEFRLETLYTGLSAGTELTFFKGTNPYLHSRWDPEFGVFRPGERGAHYPVRFLGYMEVGRVVESRSDAVQVGEVLGMSYGHKTGHTASGNDFFVRLGDLDPLVGIYAAQMGPICVNGLLHAAAEFCGENVKELGDGVRGRRVLVTGGGVVGLLTGLLARIHGAAEVTLADRTPQRLEAARALGLTPLDERVTEAGEWCKAHWVHGPGDRGADLVLQCRGQAASLQTALRALRPQGSVIDLAFYQGGAPEVRLGEEFHHNGLTIRCAQIGRVPRGLAATWDRHRLARETLDLLRGCGDLIRETLITDIVPFGDVPAFLAELAARQRHAIQAVFRVGG
ncbi:zinc-binding alcohol dehydrogenase (plasmid) [Deinococcus metallilatus]|uniref:Zinc-binding dehydrogenase n=1 Tax=Deinococcus metallilatus TaxID=1211322 RepID=A0AAJ5F7Q5_9DEIO|nr:zinc-binding dehydrogenase [Deinococcus metallilatus]MBB5293319.1 hypothetical protein [Deinococcus metallilatus]QBY06426.1 zinc-binding alcohol dehydrogenase [Deinococcus metallilatus]RXJ18105.1 zinc-binding alcohol dehydrogenase [Deinococcus metallilatus]TLK32041.1 zinc-binding dehydrogenase [Deinococcus metallilatus]GMA15458.1 hypothetical protein GCM10025871_17890 [Deinococcus metallilatus]